jgi:YHS domain-containing protein
MVRLLWIVILAGLLYLTLRELFGTGSRGNKAGNEGEEMVKDPCCGVYLSKSSAVLLRRMGKNLYFCSEECREKYKRSAK